MSVHPGMDGVSGKRIQQGQPMIEEEKKFPNGISLMHRIFEDV
jgi:hypothetical protein